jgi:putative colanic acid biosynthesis glycosyltransferase
MVIVIVFDIISIMIELSIVTISRNNIEGLVKTANTIPVDADYIEWIVIDGDSEDGTRNFLGSLPHKELKFISEADQGIFDAMNKGLRLAKGELIIFLNAGDSFVSEHIPSTIISAYKKDPWVWAIGGAVTVNSKGDFLWRWPSISPQSWKLRFAINSYCHQSTVYLREQLLQFNGFITDSLHSDWITSLQFLELCPPVIVNEDWTYFLAGGISSTQSLDYWYSESIRLRRLTGTTLWGSKCIDSLIQKMLKIFLKSTRGQVLRPDLVG